MASGNIKFGNISNFLEKVTAVDQQNENSNIISFISNIDWHFISNANDEEIGKFLSIYTELLVNVSKNKVVVLKLCEIVMKYLYINPLNNNNNYQPFILLIWNLYYLNPCLKSNLCLVMSHIFPHYMAYSVDSLAGYISNILDLVSVHTYPDDNVLWKYNECNALFINDMQHFILSEIIKYIIDLDATLVLNEIWLSESGRSTEVQLKLSVIDKIMCLLHNFINKNSRDIDSEFNWLRSEDLFKKFKRIYKNQLFFFDVPNTLFHVHYILAFATGVHPSLSKHTCEYFWTIGTDDDQPMNMQLAAWRNLTGYVAKFNFINIELVLEILTEMFAWCNEYMDRNILDINEHHDRHRKLYIIANGALFILLHRHKEILDFFGDISKFSAYADEWQLSSLTMHRTNILREFPFRDQLPDLCKLFRRCFLGFIDTIVEEQVMRTGQPTLLTGMPFRFNFLKDSKELLMKYRVSTERHYILN